MTAKKAVAKENPPKQKPLIEKMQAVQAGPPELPKPDELASPYPANVRVYAYQPKDGSDPILLAMNGFETPDKVWHFDTAQLPVLTQTWKWMERANIPKDIQRRTQMLPDKEYFDMFDEWFAAMKIQNAGAVTAGK